MPLRFPAGAVTRGQLPAVFMTRGAGAAVGEPAEAAAIPGHTREAVIRGHMKRAVIRGTAALSGGTDTEYEKKNRAVRMSELSDILL